MTDLLNLENEMLGSLDATRLHHGSVIQKDSQVDYYPSILEWCHRICNLEDNLHNVLNTGRIYACLPYEILDMDKISLNRVGMMVVNAMVGHGDHIMSTRF